MTSKVKVAIAAPKKTAKPFNFGIDSSTGAFQVCPVFYREVLPDGEIHCENPFFLVYSNPMSVPSLAKYDFNFNRFFVPYKYVWPAWEDFQLKNLHYYPSNAGTPVAPAIPLEKPYIKQNVLLGMLVDADNGFAEVLDNSTGSDFSTLSTNALVKYYKWTRLGLMSYKILCNLGYRLSFDFNDTRKFEILTLFAYGKCYLEYYYPRNYAFTSSTYYNIYSAFVSDNPLVEANTNNGNAQYYRAVKHILKDCILSYFNNSEYYDAWDNPVGPNSGNMPNLLISDPTDEDQVNSVFTQDNGTPASFNADSTPSFTHWIQQALMKITNFVKRYQLVGNATIDRWLATFGIKLPDDHRARHLGSTTTLLRINSINATADGVNTSENTGSVLGDRGGNGTAISEDIKFDFENRENTHGLFLILMNVSLDMYLVGGIDKMRLAVSSDDILQPEFDAMGPEMVTAAEIFNSEHGILNDAPSSFFGFLPQGYRYCLSRHIMSGALIANSFGGDKLKGWFVRRPFTNAAQYNMVHTLDFMHPQTSDLDAANYPFYDQKYSENFIYTIQFDDCVQIDSKKPLSDTYDWEEDVKNGTMLLENQGTLIH